jgi:hypothetical protein
MTLTRRHLGGLALTLSIAGAAVPAASARPLEDRSEAPAPQTRVVRVDPGFDWSDAQIGAAAALLATMVGVGGTSVLRSRHAS